MAFKSPKDTVAAVEAVGIAKAGLSKSQLLVLGFLAGAFIAFGGLLAIVVGGGIPAIKINVAFPIFYFLMLIINISRKYCTHPNNSLIYRIDRIG